MPSPVLCGQAALYSHLPQCPQLQEGLAISVDSRSILPCKSCISASSLESFPPASYSGVLLFPEPPLALEGSFPW